MSAVRIIASSDWMYAIDMEGRVWERPLPVAGFGEKWEQLLPLPGSHRAESMIVTPDSAVHVVTDQGGIFRYLADTWEDESLPRVELPQ
jgi:hypothetical protein